MIEIDKAENSFIKYTQEFDLSNNIGMHRKFYHSFRVEKIAETIAKSLKLNEEEVNLATVIGLLHDIGRFEQLKQFDTFNDSSKFDHGDFGAKFLSNNLRDFMDTDKYDNIIVEAVRNHNKYSIDSNLNDKEILFSKIVRDADKVDILYLATGDYWDNQESLINTMTISNYTYDCIKANHLVKYQEGVELTELDNVILTLAFVFDLNYQLSFQIIKENNYINDIFKRFNFKDNITKTKMKEIQTIVNNYIDSKLSF